MTSEAVVSQVYNDDRPRVKVKVERNSRGINWEAEVANCLSVEQAMSLLHEVADSMGRTYGAGQSAS